jgi:hypothetical protein
LTQPVAPGGGKRLGAALFIALLVLIESRSSGSALRRATA